jgi:uncharacterized membrane-anchored protein
VSDSAVQPAGVDRAFAWLKGHERLLLLAAAGFHLVVLVGMIVWRMIPLWTGTTLLVRVEPVDPRDLFRGDYVTLGYEFSRVPPQGIEGLSDPYAAAGRTIYVTLVPEPESKHWKAEKMSVHQPAGGTYLRGRVNNYGRIEYGIESYFVQEGKGHDYEKAVRDRRLFAEIAVTASGAAALRRLVIE